jgi:hypothetical protein
VVVIRPRLRTLREQAYWDGLAPGERAAFLVGQLVGSGAGVPEPRLVLHLRAQLDDPDVRLCARCQHAFEVPDGPGQARRTLCDDCRVAAATPIPLERICIECGATFQRPAGVRGHPPTRCPTCRGIAA